MKNRLVVLFINSIFSLYFAGKDWKWGGCSDNVAFGQRISKQYIDELETGKDERAIVNLHNNEAGRRVSIIIWIWCRCWIILSKTTLYINVWNFQFLLIDVGFRLARSSVVSHSWVWTLQITFCNVWKEIKVQTNLSLHHADSLSPRELCFVLDHLAKSTVIIVSICYEYQ